MIQAAGREGFPMKHRDKIREKPAAQSCGINLVRRGARPAGKSGLLLTSILVFSFFTTQPKLCQIKKPMF
jgi:hypothetical protein